MTQRIGFIGLGLMGSLMSARLLHHGFAVTVWNRSADKVDALTEKGARPASDVNDLIGQSDVIMLCLSDTAAVEQVIDNNNAFTEATNSGKTVVDFSSIDPLATRQLAQRLRETSGIRWVDAPVSGGTAGAADGTLVIFAGGEESDVNGVLPLLEPLSQRVTHMGAAGAGQMTKVCNQMIVACNAAVIGEMVALGRAAGIDVAKLPQALAGGFADSKPLQILGPQMAQRDFTLKWKVATLLKDLETAVGLGDRFKQETPMSTRGAELLHRHAGQGYADQDLSTLIEFFESGSH